MPWHRTEERACAFVRAMVGFRVAAIVLIATAALGSCGGDESSRPGDRSNVKPIARAGSPVSLAKASRVKERYENAIWDAYPGIVGVGVGAAGSGMRPLDPQERSHAILVFLDSASARPEGPQSISGVPIKFEVTGQISIQQAAPAG